MITDKDSVANSFTILASQFRGEVDFGFSSFDESNLNEARTKYKISQASILIFGSSSTEPVYRIPTSGVKRGALYKQIKSIRFDSVVRISHQEQFDDFCPITYEERQPLCLVFLHFGNFDSEPVRSFLEWGSKNAAEMASEAKIVIISGDSQPAFAKTPFFMSVGTLIQKFAPLIIFSNDELHIILNLKDLEICEHSSFLII